MTLVKLGDYPPHSPEWHALRAGHLGASDMGVLLGYGYKSRAELLAEKANPPTEHHETDGMKRGRWLEPALLAYAADRGYVPDPAMHGTWHNTDYPWATVNPDGVTASGVLIECKSTSVREPGEWGRGGSSQVPPGYLAQVTLTCGVMGLEKWVLPVLATKPTPDDEHAPSTFDWALYKGSFDPKFFAFICRLADRFMADLAELKEQQ